MAFRPRVMTERDFLSRSRHLAPGPTAKVPDNIMTRLVTYIPTEVVGGYVTGSGLVNGLVDQHKGFLGMLPIGWFWLVFCVFLVLSVVYTFLATRDDGKPQWYQTAVAPLAFSAWAFALGGPFKIWLGDDYNSAGAAVLLFLVTTMIPVADKIVDTLTKPKQ